MDEGLDTGPVIDRRSVPIGAGETGGSLHDRLSVLGADTLLSCVQRLRRGEPIEAKPQPESGVSYAAKLDKAEARIDWHCSAEVLQRRVRAFNPWPVAWCMVGAERTRVWQSEVIGQQHDREPGTVLAAGKHGVDVATGIGVLRLLELQRPGKRRMSAADYINAVSLPDRLDSGDG
jgi:methionyl-tRNA formyltransferase